MNYILFSKPIFITIDNRISISKRNIYTGIILAVTATLIWSGNFIVARGIAKLIPPVALAFYRWTLASLVLVPFAITKVIRDRKLIVRHLHYLIWVALTGISLFNTLLYIAAHTTSAINLALIGTTSSPVFATILAGIFLKEKIGLLRVLGLLCCITGILMLLSAGDPSKLMALQFTLGDAWTLLAALTFAIYNTLVKKKPSALSPLSFLFSTFLLGSLILFPFYLFEKTNAAPVQWTSNLYLIILYLGAGASVAAYLCWNTAIGKLGAARTALFGNLIPVFSIVEAVIFLHERINWVHILSGLLILSGLMMANIKNDRSSAVIKGIAHAE